jgi:hypothetical protein
MHNVRMDPIAQEELHRNLLSASSRGHQQRATAAVRAAEPPGGGDPEFADELLVGWGYGTYSATKVNKLARLATRAGAVGGYLRELAALGSNGTQPQNCSTGIMELIRSILGAAIIPVMTILIPMFVAKSAEGKPEPEFCACGVILPHIWFAFLYKHYRKDVSNCSLGVV